MKLVPISKVQQDLPVLLTYDCQSPLGRGNPMWLYTPAITLLVPSFSVSTSSWWSLSPSKNPPKVSRVGCPEAEFHACTKEADWNHISEYEVVRAVAILRNCWVVQVSPLLMEQSRMSARKVQFMFRGWLLLRCTSRIMSTTRKIAIRTEIMMAATFHLKTQGNRRCQDSRGSFSLCLISLINIISITAQPKLQHHTRHIHHVYLYTIDAFVSSNLDFLELPRQYNNFMFEQLVVFLAPHRQLSEEQAGRTIDHLRRIPYFSTLNSAFGADYLLFMLPLLEPYVLRQGLSLIGKDSHYLLVDGELHEVQERFSASRIIQKNQMVDIREKESVRFEARTDCKMIKIRRGAAGGLAQYQKRLMLKERERVQEGTRLRKLMKGKELKSKVEFLRAIEFFGSLGEFDLLELAVQSHIQEYSQGSCTHALGEQVEAIGCVLLGKIKLSFPSGSGQAVGVQAGEGEWVGLEEYLWEGNFRSSGEAASVSAKLVWIPRDVFRSKFNLSSNYSVMNRLVGLVEAKKALFDRSLDCRRRKQAELAAEEQALRSLNVQLLQKISAMNTQHQRRNNNFRKVPQEIELPEKLLHRSKILSETTPVILPKLFERVNLFPQEFQHTPIGVTQLRQMQRLAQIVKHHRGQEGNDREVHRPQQNPQIIYKSILSRVPHSPPRNGMSQRVREPRPNTRANSSIYNNFRVGKSSLSRDAFPKSKTLSILP